MQAPFSLFLALRYLRPKRTFVSVITVISVLGVILGVMVLIVVISVMTGFERTLQKAILGFEPHLRVTNGEIMRNWREVMGKIDNGKIPGLVAVAPYVQGPVLVEHEGRVNPAILRGIDVEAEEKLIDLKKFVIGTVDMPLDSVIVGKELAMDLGANIGDEITIYAPGNIHGILQEIQRESDDPNAKPKTLAELKGDVVFPAPMKIVGLINSGRNSVDSSTLLVPLTNAQALYELKDGVHGLSVNTTNPYDVRTTKRLIDQALDGKAFTTSWFDENRERFEAIDMERHVMFIILFFIVLVAAFGIMNTLITVTVQKKREIGIMKALGARTSQIVWVFLWQGMFVGALGTVGGLVTGMTVLYYRNPFRDWLSSTLHIQVFPPGIYEFEGIPAEIVPHDVAVICIGAFLLCSLAALAPAYAAARLDPVKALRED
ncbi:FtsX-like permease family protein [Chthoniobacter flavus]|uniref:FtsX-like permease family protein n=1 Tax=Chthoniobacter flavus TaxID=191863 RepID=UPI0005B28B0A|nr:FtsX-like permease family protein [Chthoniobacter flavus]